MFEHTEPRNQRPFQCNLPHNCGCSVCISSCLAIPGTHRVACCQWKKTDFGKASGNGTRVKWRTLLYVIIGTDPTYGAAKTAARDAWREQWNKMKDEDWEALEAHQVLPPYAHDPVSLTHTA
eukprot:1003003-Rhodomonas_salina.2